jgi:hypothetical protein
MANGVGSERVQGAGVGLELAAAAGELIKEDFQARAAKGVDGREQRPEQRRDRQEQWPAHGG